MPFGENVCQPVGVFCSIDAVLNQIQRFDETSRTENIAQRPVAPRHTSIRVGVICRAGPLVMPTKPTQRLVATGTRRELPERTSASSSKTKAKPVTVYLCQLAMTPSDYVDLDIIPFWGDMQIAPGAADESFGFIISTFTALRFGCKAAIRRGFLRLRPSISPLSIRLSMRIGRPRFYRVVEDW